MLRSTEPDREDGSEIVDGANDAILFADRKGVIRLWNSGAESIFGHTEDEALGQTLDLIIPDRFRQRHWEGFNAAMLTGSTKYSRDLLAVPAVAKDEGRRSIEFSMVIMTDTGGVPIGAAAIVREVSERRQREKELTDRIADLEARVGEESAT